MNALSQESSRVAAAPLILIAGPCVVEPAPVMQEIAERLKGLCERHGFSLVFKASYEKDNRTRGDSYRGPGLERGLVELQRIRDSYGLRVLTDVHRAEDVNAVAEVADILQIPAFLSRQTRLLEAVGSAGRGVNLKKGQFLSASQLAGSVAKLRGAGAKELLITERGSSFGYERLVCDFTALPALRALGDAVVYDAGHASNDPADIPLLARAAVAIGADGVFIETHPQPERALCDGGRMLSLDRLEGLLPELGAIARASSFPC